MLMNSRSARVLNVKYSVRAFMASSHRHLLQQVCHLLPPYNEEPVILPLRHWRWLRGTQSVLAVGAEKVVSLLSYELARRHGFGNPRSCKIGAM